MSPLLRLGGARTRVLSLVAAVGFAAAPAHAESPPVTGTLTYTLTDLSTLGLGDVTDLNNHGDVSGSTSTSPSRSDGTPAAYIGGTLRTFTGAGSGIGVATGISDAGHVVGAGQFVTGRQPQGFFFDGAATHDLNLASGGAASPADVNSAGTVVGTWYPPGGVPSRAFTYSGGTFTDLGTFGWTRSGAFEIDDNGRILGTVSDSTGGSRGFVLDGATFTLMPDIPGMTDVGASSMNAAGQMSAGARPATGHGRAYLFDGATYHEIAPPAGFASVYTTDINESGTIVGAMQRPSPDNSTVAFVFSGGVLRDLNELIDHGSGWQLTRTVAINDLGQIVGTGTFNGRLTAFLRHAHAYAAPANERRR